MTTRIIVGDCRDVLRTLPDASVQCCVTNLTEFQVAYLAGLIDGEGSLETQKQMGVGSATPRYVLRLSFVFGTAEPVTTVAGWLGMEPRQYPPPSPRHSPRWRLNVTKGLAIPLLRRTLPHLILKREQAELMLRIEAIRAENSVDRRVSGPRSNLRMPAHAVNAMESLHVALRALKSNKRPETCR